MSYTGVNQLGHTHLVWLKSLGFYKDEIRLMRGRLEEVAAKNSSFEARQGIEHYENQFTVQLETIDELNHSINQYAGDVAKDVQLHAGHINELLVGEYESLEERYQAFEKNFNVLRQDFKGYLAKWM